MQPVLSIPRRSDWGRLLRALLALLAPSRRERNDLAVGAVTPLQSLVSALPRTSNLFFADSYDLDFVAAVPHVLDSNSLHSQ